MGQVNRLRRLELVTTRIQEQIVEHCVMLKNRIRTCRAMLKNRINIGSVGIGMVGHCRSRVGWEERNRGGGNGMEREEEGMGWDGNRGRGCMRVRFRYSLYVSQLYNGCLLFYPVPVS